MKKLLSVLLALVMLVSVISVPAFAEGEELSVVYVANGETLAVRTAADGVALDSTYAVDYRAPNTSEKYFTGWYLNEDCTGEPVASINVEVDGANYLYAGYEKFKTVMQGVPYNSADTRMVYPAMDAGGVYRATTSPLNTGYANIHTGVDEDGTVYWLRSKANGAASSQSFPILDENGVAYQFREGSTYKISFKMKNFGVNGAYGGGKTVVGLGKNAESLKSNGAWEGENKGVGSRSPIDQKQVASASQTRGYTTWKELSDYVAATGLPEGAHPLFFLYIESIEDNAELAFKDLVIEEVSVEYYVEDELIKANYGIANGAAVELINLEDYYDIPEGKEFSGWYLDKECTQAATALTATGAVKLYAKVGEPPKAKYIAGDKVVKEEPVELGQTYTPENINLNDAQYADAIPEGYYFTGWYTDAECTTPVAKDDLTNPVTIAGDFIRYAGIKPYEKSFDVNLVKGSNADKYKPIYSTYSDGTLISYALTNAYNRFTAKDGYVETPTGGAELTIFLDENGIPYHVDPNATYKFTFEYMYNTTATDDRIFRLGVGYKGYNADGTLTNKNSPVTTDLWGDYKEFKLTKNSSVTEWTPAEFEFTLKGKSLTGVAPVFAFGNGYMVNTTLQIRNFRVEKLVADVNVYVSGELDKTVEVNFGETYNPATPAAPDGKVFKGWYLDAEGKNPMPAGGITVENTDTINLYAIFGEPPKAKYIAGDRIVKEQVVEIGQTYTPENFMLDAEYIPDGYYFTGWYTDAACTVPVKIADLTKAVTITGDFIRYAGLSEYEKEFSPVSYTGADRPATIESIAWGGLSVLQYPLLHEIKDDEDNVINTVFTNYIPSNGQNFSPVMTKDGDDTIYSYSTGSLGVFVFYDENGKVFKAKPGATYKVTFKYQFKEASTVTMYMNLGYPASYISENTGNVSVQGYRLSGSANANAPSGSIGGKLDGSATTWADYEATLATPAGTGYEPFFYIRNNGIAGNIEIKNIKVEMITAKVNVHVGENVETVELDPGTKFIPETPAAPEGKLFKGWYLDANFETAMDAEGVVVSGETNLYAKFGAPLSVVYNYEDADGNPATKAVTQNVTLNSTFAIDFVAPNTTEKYFVGWYDNAEFTGTPVKSINVTVDDANNLYARYKEFKTNYTVNFPSSVLNTTSPKAYLPVMGSDGVYHSQARINNYWQSMTYVDEEGGYYRINNNNITQLLFVDEEGFAYQAREGAVYTVSIEYRIPTGDNSVTAHAYYGRDSYNLSDTDAWRDEKTYKTGYNQQTLTAVENEVSKWQTTSFTVDGSEVDLDGAIALIGMTIGSFSGQDTFEFRNLKVKEVGAGDSGEYNAEIGGVVYEAGEVLDGETYAVTFDYAGAAANFGFFTADKDGATYANVGYVDGNNTVLAVNGDGTYTAFVTVDKASAQGAKLYMYAKGVETAGEIGDVTVTLLANAITNEGTSILEGKTSAQAIRYYFGYDTTDGANIILGGKSYAVVKRGFLFANGEGDKIDDGVYVGATGTINKFVSGEALANCWKATETSGGNFNIWYSTYVDGFAADDTRYLFVKGYITFTDGTNEFTIYADATNASVAKIAALQ